MDLMANLTLNMSETDWGNWSQPFGQETANATSVEGLNSTTVPPGVEEEHPEAYLYKITEDFFLGIDPVLTVVGLLGNLLTFIVMQRQALKGSTVTIYLSALAVTDSLVLLLDFINNWLKMSVFRIYLLGSSVGFCKSHRFFFNVCYTYSAWLVAEVALERFIVVWFPLKAKLICTKKLALGVVLTSPVLICALYLYNLWAWTVNEDGKCDMVPAWVDFQSSVGPWLSAVAYSYIPAVLIICASIGIIIKLVLARRQRASMQSVREGNRTMSVADRKITIMVIAICVTFLLLTLPLTFWYVIVFAAGEYVEQGPRTALIEVVILTLGLSNHAGNFFLYTLTSERFRAELVTVLLKCMPFLKRFQNRRQERTAHKAIDDAKDKVRGTAPSSSNAGTGSNQGTTSGTAQTDKTNLSSGPSKGSEVNEAFSAENDLEADNQTENSAAKKVTISEDVIQVEPDV